MNKNATVVSHVLADLSMILRNTNSDPPTKAYLYEPSQEKGTCSLPGTQIVSSLKIIV